MATAKDKRRYPRTAHEVALALILRPRIPGSPEASRGLHVSTRDISLTGISVLLSEPIRPDTDVELSLVLEEDADSVCHLHGTVAWCGRNDGQLLAGIALDLERADGRTWAGCFQPDGSFD
ncbi:PilZ domain-containing protein [Alcanivorax sp. JB21]|uniref:PilZ domain-containing protein n=1 Tax=Alcanivorax limicola TaxID=2874102 RepID=UPI001CC19569|nr:PilZ domain-containing protein [Alcanivorax limicola]MBZ2190543.1 PilZ domain-containing protein [Alcanivorax limicola]